MKKYIVLLPVFILYIAVFRFFYLSNGLSVIVKVLFPILLGIAFASILNPILVYIQKSLKIVNRYAAIFLTYLFIILIISLIITMIAPNMSDSVKRLIKDIPILFYKTNLYISKFNYNNLFLKNYLMNITQKFSEIMTYLLNYAIDKVVDIVSAIGNLFLALIISIYVLYDKEKIEMWFYKLFYTIFGKQRAREIFKIIHSLYDNISSYISGKLIASFVSGFLIFMGSKYIIKNPYPLIDGLIIGITDIIPYFGTFLGGIPVILISALYNSRKGFLTLIYILIIQQIESLIIDPRILGSRLEIKPVIIIISIIIGGGLFGAAGLFFSTPIAALIKQFIDAYVVYKLKDNNSQNVNKS